MKLLSLAARKKEKAIREFIVENRESLYRFAYTYVKNEHDALDVVHDAICRILDNIDSLNNIENIKPWIYKIVSNTAIDNIRKNNKYITAVDDIEESVEYDKYKDIDLHRAVGALPDKYKIIIILRYFEDMKISEISDILDENESTIKTRLYKALSILRNNNYMKIYKEWLLWENIKD